MFNLGKILIGGAIVMEFRIEKDSLGNKEVPTAAYYGIQTLRAVENFPITGVPVHPELIVALAHVKKAAAQANAELKRLPHQIAEAIIQAAEEVSKGQWLDQFIVDSIQGGAGTSINMNMNEVLANRALEIMGHDKGDYFHCNPNNHVNMSQSTNDTIPTALRIAAYSLSQRLLNTMGELQRGFVQKEIAFDDVLKMGRTHLQDAVPIRMGQEFGAYARVLGRDIGRITSATTGLLPVNIGATAVGTGLNATIEYIHLVVTHLAVDLKIPLVSAADLVDATQNTDAYTELSASLKVCAVNLSKICNDIRLMASGPKVGLNEIMLPPRQPGSSIMPGKVNPVMAEVVNQVAFQVMGNDHTICMASEAGQFELNVMGPVIAFNLLQSLQVMQRALDVFNRFALEGMEANRIICQSYVDQSFGIVTALNPHLGYDVAAQLVKEAMATGLTIKELIIERHLLSEAEINEILDPVQMTTPGIAGERLLRDQP
jgi:aspartate ammonia-lyase